MITIQPYDPARDEAATFDLWQRALGAQWPITPELLRQVIEAPGTHNAHLVARAGVQPVGLAMTQQGQQSNLVALLVDPDWQRRGIGTALHEAALDQLRGAGAKRVQIGGGETRFWPGVPANLRAARPFFEARGWTFNSESIDLTQDLRGYQTPATLRSSQVILRVATPADVNELLEFEQREFPAWLGAYQVAAQFGDTDDFLLACDPQNGAIVGALIMYTPRSHPGRTDVVWTTLLGDDAGGLGCVGVAKDARKYGAGTALVARGSEIAKERGVGNCFIGWTGLRDFYGRLGYREWQAYAMSKREL
jgi:beta-N-acetylhexosaminidase